MREKALRFSNEFSGLVTNLETPIDERVSREEELNA
jgi:hypothetical protein